MQPPVRWLVAMPKAPVLWATAGGRLQPAPSAGGSGSLKSAPCQPGRDYACSSLLIRLLGLTRHSQGIRTLPLAGMWPGDRPTAKTVLSALHIQKVMGDTGLSCFVLRTSCPRPRPSLLASTKYTNSELYTHSP